MHPTTRHLHPCTSLLGIAFSAALGVAACVTACGGKGDAVPAAAIDDAVVPAPATLTATVVVPTPNASWGKLQRTVGGGAGLMPATLGGLAVSLLAVDGALVGEIDGASPAYAAALGAWTQPDWVVALKVVDVRRARGLVHDAGTRRAVSAYPFDITDNGYLVVGSTAAALEIASAYVSRALPKRKPAGHAVELTVEGASVERAAAAFRESAATLLADLDKSDDAMRTAHAGRPPDFGDPKVLLAAARRFVDARSAEISDLASFRAHLDLEDDAVLVEAELQPKSGNGAATARMASLTKADVGGLRAFPREVDVAFALAENTKERESDAAFVAELGGQFMGSRVSKEDQARMARVVTALFSAGDATVAGSLSLSPSPSVFLRKKTSDGTAYARAVDDLAELLRVPALREPLHLAEVRVVKEAWQGGNATTLSVRREPIKGAARGTSPLDKAVHPIAVFASKGGDAYLAASADPAGTLSACASPARTLGDDQIIAKYIDRAAGDDASFVLFSAPLRLTPGQIGAPAMPVSVGVGKTGGGSSLRVRALVAMGILREKARLVPR